MDTQTQPTTNSPQLSWTAHTHVQHQRSPRWYIYAGTILLFCLLYSIATSAWSFSTVILLMAGLYFFVHNYESDPKTITITEHGVQLEKEFTSWNECVGFWMLQSQDYTELHIQRQRRSEIVIQTGAADPNRVREVLAFFIPEFTGKTERLLDMIIRILKI